MLSRTVSEFIAAYCSNFGHFAFLSQLWGGGGLGTMYDVYLGLIGKREVEFVLVLIELFRYIGVRLRRYYGRK